MDLNKLYEIQSTLDQRIKNDHGLEGANLVPCKVLALLVELGELANETKTFKYWSKKPASSKEVILEEYVDCLHFILSLGLDHGYADVNMREIKEEITLVDQLNIMFTTTVYFKDNGSKDSYDNVFNNFLNLGKLLGFTIEDIFNAYMEKNRINHQRQDEGY